MKLTMLCSKVLSHGLLKQHIDVPTVVHICYLQQLFLSGGRLGIILHMRIRKQNVFYVSFKDSCKAYNSKLNVL